MPEPKPETSEEKTARLQRQAAAAEAARIAAQEIARKAEEAEQRALELLREHLSEEQRQQLDTERHFTVVAESGKRYRVRVGLHGNVEELDDSGKSIASYCICSDVPKHDNMLSQKLMLETDEKRFLATANRRQIA